MSDPVAVPGGTTVVLLVSRHRVTAIVGRLNVAGREESAMASRAHRSMRERSPVEIAGQMRQVLAIHADRRPGLIMLDLDR